MLKDMERYDQQLVFVALKGLLESGKNAGMVFHNGDPGHPVYHDGADGTDTGPVGYKPSSDWWSEWKVPEGEKIVHIEVQIAGWYISRLQFFTDRYTASPLFGKKPGNLFVVNAPCTGWLRTISGNVDQTRHSAKKRRRAVTSMTFHFDVNSMSRVRKKNFD